MRKHVLVSTARYRSAHGHRPGGRGYWVFTIRPYVAADYTHEAYGLYSEAKKSAIKAAKVNHSEATEYHITVMA